MLMKRVVTLGLSVMLSVGLFIPVSALESGNNCQGKRQQAVRTKTCNVSEKMNNKDCRESYKSCNKDKRYSKKDRYKSFMNKTKKYGENWNKEERYDWLKKYFTERMEDFECGNTQTPEPEVDTDTQTPEKPNDTGDQTPTTDTGENTPNQTEIQGVSEKEQQMIDLVNEAREENGLEPLIVDPDLTKLAGMKSQDMIDKNYFSHNSPTYGSPFDMLKNYGVSYKKAGENIAGNHSVDKAHQSLMNSPGHRQNILNPDYTHIGIGIQEGGMYGNMFTQLFTKK